MPSYNEQRNGVSVSCIIYEYIKLVVPGECGDKVDWRSESAAHIKAGATIVEREEKLGRRKATPRKKEK